MLEPDRVLGLLNDQFPVPDRYWIGYSGGVDSTVLLHLLAALRDRLPAPLAAIHIDHGLQAASADWAQHCRAVCGRLNVPLTVLAVDAVAQRGDSPEAAARAARYAAIAGTVGVREMLLTAHHRDDQAETLLLQLLRGAGVEGLAAMPTVREWQRGWHARPLLGVRRSAIRAWALANRLQWIDDPSNAETHADRNYLRQRVMPALLSRWPAAVEGMVRSAAHCGAAAEAIHHQSKLALRAALSADGRRLRVDVLRDMPAAEAAYLLRLWIRRQALPALSARRLDDALDQLCHARPDADVRIGWEGVELRRFRDQVWLVPARLPEPPTERVDWLGEEFSLGAGRGRVSRRLAPGGIDPQRWSQGRVQITYRDVGRRYQPAGRAGSRPFKKLAQECGIPPWWRGLTPVVLIDDQPAAIANCCVCEPFAATAGESGWVIEWTPD